MSEYEGPSFFKHTKKQSTKPSTNRLKENLQSFQAKGEEVEEKNLFTERNSHTLPDQIIKRDEIEKGFQEYLNDKNSYSQNNRSKHYIAPPFEASKVPSPIFGYKKPLEKKVESWDFTALKEDLKKESFEFLLFEEFETSELKEYWEMQISDTQEKYKDIKESETAKEQSDHDTVFNINQSSKVKQNSDIKVENPSTRNKRMRLQQSLMNIIKEEQLGKNEKKRNLPGFFSDENE